MLIIHFQSSKEEFDEHYNPQKQSFVLTAVHVPAATSKHSKPRDREICENKTIKEINTMQERVHSWSIHTYTTASITRRARTVAADTRCCCTGCHGLRRASRNGFSTDER